MEPSQLNKLTGRKLLVLDLDSTLIWTDFREFPLFDTILDLPDRDLIWLKKRPFLKTFFDYCFTNYDVAVWSAGAADYVDAVCEYLFPDRHLIFIFSHERCTHHKGLILKKLAKIWRVKHWPYYRSNTLILDDTPETYLQNYGNAIPIRSYLGQEVDRELLRVISLLKRLKLEDDVRHIEKRY
jgi:TFIIF-interacting CTD phosphatase-like protein